MITNPAIDEYILNLLPPRDAVLAEMEAYAAEHKVPIVGPAVGSLLGQFVMISGAKRIFELGSAIGYSTIWLARAAGEGAEIHYSDASEDNARRAREYFRRAGVEDRVHVHVGEALGCLAQVPGEFDLIFNDVDKHGYLGVLDAVPVRLRTGGLFISDNALWHERVLNPTDETSRIVVEFNHKVFTSNRFISTILPLRDGVLVSWKR